MNPHRVVKHYWKPHSDDIQIERRPECAAWISTRTGVAKCHRRPVCPSTAAGLCADHAPSSFGHA